MIKYLKIYLRNCQEKRKEKEENSFKTDISQSRISNNKLINLNPDNKQTKKKTAFTDRQFFCKFKLPCKNLQQT